MNLKERIQTDIKECMKSRDKKRVAVLRMLLSEMQYAETSTDGAGALDDAKATKVVSTYEKRLVKSLNDFPEGEKTDEIKFEIGIVANYLPKKATEEEIVCAIDKFLGESEERSFGVVMKKVMAVFGATADGKVISKILKEKLS